MSRLDDLREHIEKAFALIAEHEKLIQTTERPEERQHSQDWIGRHWQYMAHWIEEAKAICLRASIGRPQWLAEAEASVPAEATGKTRASNLKEPRQDSKRLALHLDHEWHSDAGMDVPEGIVEVRTPYLPSPLKEESIVYRWEREMLGFAHVSVVLEKTKRVLRQRSAFRPEELWQMGVAIEQAGHRASELEQMVTDSPETLLHSTLEPRALDDLRHIAALSELVVEALDNLDVEASLGEPASSLWLEQAEQNFRALDHYIASACDWMVLGQPGTGLDLSSDTLP